MFKLSIISDEISHNLSEALEFAKDNQLDYIDVRSVDRVNLIDLELPQIRTFSRIINQAGLNCFCYPSPLLKWPIDLENREHLIAKGFEIANILGCKYIRIFSYLKCENFSPARLAKDLEKLNALAEQEDKYLLLENEPICNLQTFQDLFLFLQKYPFSRLLALPDLGNQTQVQSFFVSSEFTQLIPFSPCIHIKDYSRHHSSYVSVGEGDSCISESLKVFQNAGAKPVLTLETHVPSNPKGVSKRSLDQIRKIIKVLDYAS